jgi:hypothetical protein
MKKILLISLFAIITTGCSELALIGSISGMTVNQNSYAKIYSGVEFSTLAMTDKSIKEHAYKKAYTFFNED